MLKEFRSIDVYWDKATRRIYEEIRSSSSDEKGRKLTVQIVNDGQIQDLTNVALNLYWETQDGESRGLDPFEPLDAENGIYELYFRTGMLQHVGKLNAHLHLVDTTGAITSEPFTIVVFQGVDVDAMASDDELSALTQALVQVNNLETTYAPRLNAVEGSVDSLTDDVALNKSNIVSNTQDIVNLDGRLTTVEQKVVAGTHTHRTTAAQSYVETWLNYPDGHTHTNTTVTVSPVTLAGSQAVALYQVSMYASQVRLRFRAFDGSTIPAGTDMTIQYQFVRTDSGD